jgi:hypothetical protein
MRSFTLAGNRRFNVLGSAGKFGVVWVVASHVAATTTTGGVVLGLQGGSNEVTRCGLGLGLLGADVAW